MTTNPNELTVENCALVLIDHQPAIALSTPSLDATVLMNNVAGLARAAKILGVPTVLTTVGATGSVLADPIPKVIAGLRERSRCFVVFAPSRSISSSSFLSASDLVISWMLPILPLSTCMVLPGTSIR